MGELGHHNFCRRCLFIFSLSLLVLSLDRFALISSFVDTYLRLNQAEEKVFQTEIAKIITTTEQEQVMEITISWMERGIEQERWSAISSGLLELRYGAINDELAAILPSLVALTSIEYTPLIYQLSKEELIERFNSHWNDFYSFDLFACAKGEHPLIGWTR
jgi:plasmid replication initiation protein